MRKNSGTIAAATAFVLLAAGAALRASRPSREAPARTFSLRYEAVLENVPPDTRLARIWIPEASSGPSQTVAVESIRGPVRTVETRDPEYGNRILYAELPNPGTGPVRFTVSYRVTRLAYAGLPEGAPPDDLAPVSRFLRPDRLVPTGGRMKALADEICRGKHAPEEIARTLYDYVFHTLRYEKTGTGWGRGDAVWACDAKHGNCTDFHSLFIALMRAEGIPARFEIGFPLPATATGGEIPGYHCWAEFHIDGKGWIPVDISEAWKAPELHDFFFGHLDVNRVQFTIGRDITLSPRQSGDPLNYFVYPYAELDGKPSSAISAKLTFRDLNPQEDSPNRKEASP
jgi:transglutaminase-like putative cysteine protease